MMDADKMRLALELASFDIKKHFEALRGENLEVIQGAGLKEEAIKFFKEFSFNEAVEIGHFHYNQANCFKKEFTWEDDFKRTIQTNLLIVGSGISGDTVVLDLEDYQVGILFHDYFDPYDDEDPRKYLVKMGCSLGEFFWNTVSVPDYPIDAYEAARYMGFEFTGYWSSGDDAVEG